MATSNSKKPWKCDFPNCHETFESEERLKKHKKLKADHDYCHYCDTGFEDWDSLTAHKTAKAADEIKAVKEWEKRELRREMMLQNGVGEHVIDGQRENDPKPDISHLCCKFCGMDFGSIAGRDTHINQQHKIDQELPCPGGCGLIFPRAAALVYHLETNECPRITPHRFAGYLQHKAIVNRLLANPELINELDNNNYIDATKDEDQTGGVKLGMLDEAVTASGLASTIEPDRPNAMGKIPVKQQTWPELSAANPQTKQTDLLSDDFESMSISKPPKPMHVTANPLPLCEDSTSFIAAVTSASSSTAAAGGTPRAAWSTESTSKSLFPDAKPTPPTSDWAAVIAAKEAAEHRSNILQYQFWNPTHRDYNPERFYNPILEEYRCPFPVCDKGMRTPWELEKHITDKHKIDRIRCPQCLKLFKSHTALISHCENATARCKLNRSDRFGQIMDEFSGGFLTAKRTRRPDNEVEIDGGRIDYVKFESCVPEDLKQELQAAERAKMVTGGVDMRGALGVRLGEEVDDRDEDERQLERGNGVAIDWKGWV